MTDRRVRVFVSGRVQGVFFRATTTEEASQLGLSGWVKNLPDGRVEAVFEGDPDAVADMIQWCHTGSPRAQVEDVDVVEEEPAGIDGFEVRR